LLNQLKSKRKKSKTDLADLEVILEILESWRTKLSSPPWQEAQDTRS
jgi:transposase